MLSKSGIIRTMQPTALYRYFNGAGDLLYVGISLRPFTRSGEHRTRANWFIEVARIELEWFGTRGDAEQAEWSAIRHEKPVHNKAYARKPPQPVERFVVLNAQREPIPDTLDLTRNVHAIIAAKRKRIRSRKQVNGLS